MKMNEPSRKTRLRCRTPWFWLALAAQGCGGDAGPGPHLGSESPSVEPGDVAVSDSSCIDAADCGTLGTGYDCRVGFCRHTPEIPAPCEGVVRRTGAPPTEGFGSLRIPLGAEGRSGTHYRLQGATFSLIRLRSGAGEDSAPEYPNLLTADSSPDVDWLDVPLPSGEYLVSLSDGWSLVTLSDAEPTAVPAALLSPALKDIRIGPDTETRLRLRFEVSRPGSDFAPAEVARALDILERPQPLSGRVCIESSIAPDGYNLSTQESVNRLEGCTEIGGDLDLGFDAPVDLSPLGELRNVCGGLGIGSSAPLIADLSRQAQSLTGLEALEEVDFLYLSHPGVISLAPLRSLRRIQRSDVENDVLGLFVTSSNFEDLRGLENVTEIQRVRIDGSERLTSLRGLTLPAEMRSVEVSGVNLIDLSALANVTRIPEQLRVVSTAVESLSALSALREVNSLGVFSNAALIDADGLGGLEASDYLQIYDSPGLTTLPVFSSLARVGALSISDLPALSGSLSFPLLGEAAQLFIENNPALETVSLPALTGIARLAIRNNQSLSSLDVPALARASQITIVNNPALDVRALATVIALQASSSKIGLNAGGQEPPRSPCPWTNDSECDEGLLCAQFSDGADCGPID